MPNWVTNKIKFRGDEKVVNSIMKEIKTCIENEDGIMNHFIPRPETYDKYDTTNYSYKNMKVGAESYAGVEMVGWEKLAPRVLTQEFIDEWKAAEEEQEQKYGYVGWYDWNHANWGCKWDMKDCLEDKDFFVCSTPNCMPDVFIKRLSSMYPDVEITMESVCEGEDGAICLKAKNGNIWEDEVSDEFIEAFGYEYDKEE